MLSRAEKQWEFMGKAGGHRSERVATNPLLRESGPVVDCDQGVIIMKMMVNTFSLVRLLSTLCVKSWQNRREVSGMTTAPLLMN